jgi:molybdopterin synthase catalytic subunit
MPGICSKCKYYFESINHTPSGNICNSCLLVVSGLAERNNSTLDIPTEIYEELYDKLSEILRERREQEEESKDVEITHVNGKPWPVNNNVGIEE